MVPLNPRITESALALLPSPTGVGLALELTHVAIGKGLYTPTGAETALASEVARFPMVAGESDAANQIQIGVNITDLDPTGRSANDQWIGEIGLYAGDTLFAVWSRPVKPLFYKTSEFDVPLAYRLDVSRLPAGAVTVRVDLGVAGMQAMLFQHEQRTNPHPQYLLKADLMPAIIAYSNGADRNAWAEQYFNATM